MSGEAVDMPAIPAGLTSGWAPGKLVIDQAKRGSK
jgi:hypothetical protein